MSRFNSKTNQRQLHIAVEGAQLGCRNMLLRQTFKYGLGNYAITLTIYKAAHHLVVECGHQPEPGISALCDINSWPISSICEFSCFLKSGARVRLQTCFLTGRLETRVAAGKRQLKQNFAWRRAFKGGVKQSREKGGISVRVCPRAAAALTQSHRVVGIESEARWQRRRRSGGVSVRERKSKQR